MNRKSRLILLALCLCAGLAACASTQPQPNPTSGWTIQDWQAYTRANQG